MSQNSQKIYGFAEFRLDSAQKILLHNGEVVSLTPKIFDTLEILVQNAGLLLEKDELIHQIWPDHFVDESNLTSNIKTLRKALGDSPRTPRFIETVPRRGYRFVAKVVEVPASELPDRQPSVEDTAPNERSKRVTSGFLGTLRLVAVVPIVLAVGLVGLWYTRSGWDAGVPIIKGNFAASKLSTGGKSIHAAVSPDGRTVVYSNGIEGKQSVWLRDLSTGSNVEIIPASYDFYDWLEIGPDGKTLFFARRPVWKDEARAIYRIGIFGGVPQKLADNTEGWMSVSPDGRRFSFVRCPGRQDENCALWMADTQDGKNEQKLISRPHPYRIGDSDISPDGKSVAFCDGQSENSAIDFTLKEVDIASGAIRELTGERFFNIKSIARVPKEGGFLVTASRVPNKLFRIWHVNSVDGGVTPLTNDSETYGDLSLDSGAQTIVSTRIQQNFRLRTLNRSSSAPPRILADASSARFTSRGNFLFSSLRAGSDDIWSMNSDGSEQRQLTNDAFDESSPVAAPNGTIFFSSNRTGSSQIWRMNADGSNQLQITKTNGGFPIAVSADNAWLYYHNALNKSLWRVSTDGGSEQVVLDRSSPDYAISHEGHLAAHLEVWGDEKFIEVNSIADGVLVKRFKIADKQRVVYVLAWTFDDQGLMYAVAESNENYVLKYQSLDGKPPQKIADLGNERVSSISVAPDNVTCAIVQGGWQYDVVMLNGLKQ